MKYLRFSGLVLLLPILPFARGQDSDARKTFQSLEPSVVSITNIEGGGSGIVLSAEGLVLTNFHVANTPLPQTVEAMVETGGRTVKRKFQHVVLLKIHSQSDLALLKVEPEGCTFKPAKISKSDRDTVAGGVCFAMGYPYVPGQDQPVLTITKGIISSARRTVGNNPYIQLDAAINPGNSGGALVNDKGVVIGIPTLKFEGADRIGLAAPLAGLKMDQFVAPEEKKGNPTEAARLSGLAMDLLMRDTFSFGSNPEAVELAVYLQREALSLEPNNARWSLNMSWMYFRLQKIPIALAYAESSVRKDSKIFASRKMLADCQETLNDHKKAAETRLACFDIPPKDGDKADRKQVAEKLASYFAGNNDPVRAIYILSWGQATSGESNYTGQRLVMQKAEGLIPKALIDEIMAKTNGHSIADMNAVASRAPAILPQAENKPLQPADISKVKEVDVVSAKFTSEVHFKAGVTARLMDSPPGVVFHQDLGTLEWTPLPLTRTAEVKVLFLLTNPDGSEEPYVHIIRRN